MLAEVALACSCRSARTTSRAVPDGLPETRTGSVSGKLLPLWRFPPTRISGAEYGFDHRHVFDGVFKRNRHLSAFADSSGEDVALNRVLVADGKVLGGNAGAEDVASVIDKDPARPVVGSVERDFDFDAAPRSQQVAPLVGHELRAASKSGLPRGKIEDG